MLLPSVIQSSSPRVPLALKSSLPFMSVNRDGYDDSRPGAMSATCAVPASVPSVDHSSVPNSGVVAVEKTRQPYRKNLCGIDDTGDALALALRSLTRTCACARNVSAALNRRRSRCEMCLMRKSLSATGRGLIVTVAPVGIRRIQGNRRRRPSVDDLTAEGGSPRKLRGLSWKEPYTHLHGNPHPVPGTFFALARTAQST